MARDRDSLPVVLVAAIPVVAIRLSVGFLRFQARRKRGVQRFRETLMQSGMPREQAARLAQELPRRGLLEEGAPGSPSDVSARTYGRRYEMEGKPRQLLGALARGRSRS